MDIDSKILAIKVTKNTKEFFKTLSKTLLIFKIVFSILVPNQISAIYPF